MLGISNRRQERVVKASIVRTPLLEIRMPSMKRDHVVLVAICVLVTTLRLVNIDADGPTYRETQYNIIDSAYYSLHALAWYNASYYAQHVDIYASAFPLNYISNVLTFTTLWIFGDNFLGFRLACVLSGTGVIALLFIITSSERGPMWAFFAATYLVLDYNFHIASREVEPTMFRTLLMMLSIFLFARIAGRDDRLSFPISTGLTFFAYSTVLLEYPTNIFSALATSSTLAMCMIRSRRDLLTYILATIAGIGAATALYLLVIWMSGDQLGLLLGLIKGNTNRFSLGPDPFGFMGKNLTALKDALFLRHVPGLLYVFIGSIEYLVIRTVVLIFQDRDVNKYRLDLLIVMHIAFLLAQTAILNDYPVRKQVIWLPLCVYAAITVLADLTGYMRGWPRIVATLFIGGQVIAISAVFHWSLISEKTIVSPTFYHRNAMIRLREFDGQYFMGVAWAFSLYNRILPVGNMYALNMSTYPKELRMKYQALFSGLDPDSPRFLIAGGKFKDDPPLVATPKFPFTTLDVLIPSRERTYRKVTLHSRD